VAVLGARSTQVPLETAAKSLLTVAENITASSASVSRKPLVTSVQSPSTVDEQKPAPAVQTAPSIALDASRPVRMRKKLSPDKWSAGFDEVADKYAVSRQAALDLKERRAIEHIAHEYGDHDTELPVGPNGEYVDPSHGDGLLQSSIDIIDYAMVRIEYQTGWAAQNWCVESVAL